MAESIANVSVTTDTFNGWILRTNEMATAMRSSVVTANNTLGVTTGNSYVNGYFSANTLIAVGYIRGGNNTTNGALTISSNAIITGAALLSNTFTVTGNATFSNTIAVTGNATFSNNVTVTGVVQLSGGANVSQLTANTIVIRETITANGSIGANGDVLRSNGSGTYWSSGAVGYTGSQGYTGSKGADGIIGVDGYTGSRGYTGSAGPSNVVNAANDTATTSLYPVMVATAGADATPKVTTSKLYFNASDGTFTVNGTIVESSTLLIKENITDLQYSINDIMNLRPVRYNRINSDKPEIGLIAEELKDVIPEIVDNTPNSLMGINYSRLVAVLINSVQELKHEIESLKKKVG